MDPSNSTSGKTPSKPKKPSIWSYFNEKNAKKELEQIFKDSTKDKFGFLLIDLETPNENNKFSKGFRNYYHIESDSDSDS